MFYLVNIPRFVKKMYPHFTWDMPADEKNIYLTFDDGPHETATPFVLDELKKHNATATFFCIGKNVVANPDIYKRIINEGHAAGNHTFNHLNGNKTSNESYLEDIVKASDYIDSNLFRPPYGRINGFQSKLLRTKQNPFKIIMWSVLSGDFDVSISPKRCLENVIINTKPGSIIVFHDSKKAWEKMSYTLPLVLNHFSNKGWFFKNLKNH